MKNWREWCFLYPHPNSKANWVRKPHTDIGACVLTGTHTHNIYCGCYIHLFLKVHPYECEFRVLLLKSLMLSQFSLNKQQLMIFIIPSFHTNLWFAFFFIEVEEGEELGRMMQPTYSSKIPGKLSENHIHAQTHIHFSPLYATSGP